MQKKTCSFPSSAASMLFLSLRVKHVQIYRNRALVTKLSNRGQIFGTELQFQLCLFRPCEHSATFVSCNKKLLSKMKAPKHSKQPTRSSTAKRHMLNDQGAESWVWKYDSEPKNISAFTRRRFFLVNSTLLITDKNKHYFNFHSANWRAAFLLLPTKFTFKLTGKSLYDLVSCKDLLDKKCNACWPLFEFLILGKTTVRHTVHHQGAKHRLSDCHRESSEVSASKCCPLVCQHWQSSHAQHSSRSSSV